MRSHARMYKTCFVAALSCLLAVVESKPAPINYVASTSVSRCLNTPPRITEPPAPGPIELIKAKRQEIGFDTCAYINNEPFTCTGAGTCTSLRSDSIDYAGCCYGEDNCHIYTACYDGEATIGRRRGNPRILSCAGIRPFCATVLWSQEPKISYMCAERPSTITVDPTADSPTPTSTNEEGTTATELTPGAPESTVSAHVPTTGAPDNPDNPSGSGPIADLTKGQKIGIGAGCGAVGLLFAAGLGYCCCCSKKQRKKTASKNVSGNGIVTVNEMSESKPHVMESP